MRFKGVGQKKILQGHKEALEHKRSHPAGWKMWLKMHAVAIM